jgi:hypothetical protein
MTTTATTVWQKNPILAWREIEGKTVIISPNDSTLHELNDTGSFVWRQIDGRRPTAEIARQLAAEYDVSLEDARRDTEALQQELVSRRLLLPADTVTTGGPR